MGQQRWRCSAKKRTWCALQVVSNHGSQFIGMVPPVTDPPMRSARNNNNGGVVCTDCTACLSGVSHELINRIKMWDAILGLLVMPKTLQQCQSPNAESGHLDTRSLWALPSMVS